MTNDTTTHTKAVEAAARALMVQSQCGLTIDGKRTFCDDPRAEDDIRCDDCECKKLAQAALTAAKAAEEDHPHITEADTFPKNLHPRTADLVRRFSVALAKKLRLAEEKYGWADGWARDDWESECLEHFRRHIEKGDPLDVAAYCAFMWAHGWTTYRPADDVRATQSIQDRAWDFVKVGFQNFGLSDERLREYAKIIEELLQGAVDDATTPLAAQIAKLTEERDYLKDTVKSLQETMNAGYEMKARAERAESELAALDKSHADLARKLANAATDIRAQTIEECAKVADEYATEMRNTVAEDSSELDSLADAEAAGLVIANRIRSLSTSPPPPSGEWRPIEACALDAAFRFYGLHVNDDRGHSWFEAHYLSVADDAQMMCPSGDVFSDWSLSDFEVWCDAAPPPPAEGGER